MKNPFFLPLHLETRIIVPFPNSNMEKHYLTPTVFELDCNCFPLTISTNYRKDAKDYVKVNLSLL